MRALAARVSLTISERNEFTEIHWPKFAEIQELPSRGRELKARPKPISAPAPAPAPAPAKTTVVNEAPAAPPPPSGSALPALLEPDDLTPNPAAIDHAANKLANLLGSGDRAKKVDFLTENLVPMMFAVLADTKDDQRTPKQRQNLLKQKIHSWWKFHNGGGRLPVSTNRPKPESFDAQQRRENLEWLQSMQA